MGNFLGFAAELDSINNPKTYRNTVANLTENYLDGGVRVLVSTLRIMATSDAPNGTVMCIHTDDGTNETMDFKVFGKFKILFQLDHNKYTVM